MRRLIFVLVTYFGCVSVYADSIHAQKIILTDGAANERSSVSESDMVELREFIENRCPTRSTVRISAQPISSNPKKSRGADLVRLRVIGAVGLPENQIFTVPGGVSNDYLRRNDLLGLVAGVKNPVVVEVFC